MTTIDDNAVRGNGAGRRAAGHPVLWRSAMWSDPIVAAMRACGKAILAAHRRRQTLRALDRLDDSTLKDIGLGRGPSGYELLPHWSRELE